MANRSGHCRAFRDWRSFCTLYRMSALLRIRSKAPYAALVLALLLIPTWVLSGWWEFGVVILGRLAGNGQMVLSVQRGRVSFLRVGAFDTAGSVRLYAESRKHLPEWACSFEFRSGRAWEILWTAPKFNDAAVPLWVPFIFIAGPSAWCAWHRRTKLGEGGCRVCGYSLAGLAAGAACPECGRAHDSHSPRPAC
jgi:hypothetical protein